jgi:hypothetical protein
MPATTATRRRSGTRPRLLGESAGSLFDLELAAAGAMHPRIVAELEAAAVLEADHLAPELLAPC